MIDLPKMRTELAAVAPAGWSGYDTLPGSANLPALVVALPESVTLDGSMKFATVNIPVFIAVGPNISAQAEITLLSKVMEIALAYQGLQGTTFRSCKVVRVTDFAPITIGSNEAYGAAIDLELLANIYN